MSLILWLIIGGIAGWMASMLMDTDKSMGLIANVVVGIVGSFLGGFIVTLLTTGTADLGSAITGFNLTSFIVSIAGAVLLLAILKAFNRAPAR